MTVMRALWAWPLVTAVFVLIVSVVLGVCGRHRLVVRLLGVASLAALTLSSCTHVEVQMRGWQRDSAAFTGAATTAIHLYDVVGRVYQSTCACSDVPRDGLDAPLLLGGSVSPCDQERPARSVAPKAE